MGGFGGFWLGGGLGCEVEFVFCPFRRRVAEDKPALAVVGVATKVAKDKLGPGARWEGWEQTLAGTWELDDATQSRYRHILLAFNAFCGPHQQGA